jgi:hypothetical protein
MQRSSLALSSLLLSLAAPLAAQSTGTPVFHAPYRVFDRYEIGANVSDAGKIAVEGFYGWSPSQARWDLALRAGVQDNQTDCCTGLLVGLDARYRVIDQNEDFPLDGSSLPGGRPAGQRRLGVLHSHRDLAGAPLQLLGFSRESGPYAKPVLGPAFGAGDSGCSWRWASAPISAELAL